jgi:hypothetical protein
MDDDVDFQRSCLQLMKEAFAEGDVSANNLAYLTDRVLTHEGRKQMYGTQGLGVTSPDDEARVDANRSSIGLSPWRDAVKERQKHDAQGYAGDGVKGR